MRFILANARNRHDQLLPVLIRRGGMLAALIAPVAGFTAPVAGFTALVVALGAASTIGSRAQDDVVRGAADVPPVLKIGAQAPAFNLPGIDGKQHSIGEYSAKKVLVIIFTCDHCPVAQMY